MVSPVTSVIHGHPLGLGLGSLGIPARRACFVGTCCQPSSATCQEAKLEPSHWIPLDGVHSVHGHFSPPSRNMGMDQYLLIPFLVGWTSIYQLFWCSPGVQGFDTLPYLICPTSLATGVTSSSVCGSASTVSATFNDSTTRLRHFNKSRSPSLTRKDQKTSGHLRAYY